MDAPYDGEAYLANRAAAWKAIDSLQQKGEGFEYASRTLEKKFEFLLTGIAGIPFYSDSCVLHGMGAGSKAYWEALNHERIDAPEVARKILALVDNDKVFLEARDFFISKGLINPYSN